MASTNRMAGIIISTDIAAMPRQSTVNWLVKSERPTGNVLAAGVLVRMRGDLVLVPGRQEGEDGGRAEARQGQRQVDLPEGLPVAGAVHVGGVVELARDAPEEAVHEPGREGDVQGHVDEGQPVDGVDEADVAHEQEERQAQGDAGHRAGQQQEQEQHAAAHEVEAREGVAGRRPDGHGERRGQQRDRQRVRRGSSSRARRRRSPG